MSENSVFRQVLLVYYIGVYVTFQKSIYFPDISEITIVIYNGDFLKYHEKCLLSKTKIEISQ